MKLSLKTYPAPHLNLCPISYLIPRLPYTSNILFKKCGLPCCEILATGLHTHAKRTIVRKMLPAKSNTFALNKTENTYRLFSSGY